MEDKKAWRPTAANLDNLIGQIVTIHFDDGSVSTGILSADSRRKGGMPFRLYVGLGDLFPEAINFGASSVKWLRVKSNGAFFARGKDKQSATAKKERAVEEMVDFRDYLLNRMSEAKHRAAKYQTAAEFRRVDDLKEIIERYVQALNEVAFGLLGPSAVRSLQTQDWAEEGKKCKEERK